MLRRRLHERSTVLLLAAAMSNLVAVFVAFVVYERASPIFFILSLSLLVVLVTVGLFINRAATFVLLSWSVIGAFSQLLPPARPGAIPILAANVLSAALILIYLRSKTGP